MSEDIRILLVDDHDLVRAGFRVILESETGLTVVGEASDGREAIERAGELNPDVICMDVQMPGLDGLDATRSIVADQQISSAILILTTFNRDDYLFAALEAGASGFLLKNSSPERLIEAVHTLASGDALLSPEVTKRVIERFSAHADPAFGERAATQPDATAQSTPESQPSAEPTLLSQLTDREAEVLGLLARGMSNAEIATMLFLGESTVKSHVSKILMKLRLRDRIQAVIFAYENGIVPLEA